MVKTGFPPDEIIPELWEGKYINPEGVWIAHLQSCRREALWHAEVNGVNSRFSQTPPIAVIRRRQFGKRIFACSQEIQNSFVRYKSSEDVIMDEMD